MEIQLLCPRCESLYLIRHGIHTTTRKQRFRCKTCGGKTTAPLNQNKLPASQEEIEFYLINKDKEKEVKNDQNVALLQQEKEVKGARTTATTIDKSFSGDEANITTKSLDIRTLEELIDHSEVDLSIWEVVSHEERSWEVTMGGDKTASGKPETFTNYLVKAKFRKIVPDPFIVAIDNICNKI